MGEVPPSHDAVRAYLDSAVAEAAERWVGRAADATAYADLVAAVLARREALTPLRHLPDRPAGAAAGARAPLPPASPAGALGRAVTPASPPRHTERRARPRWPLGGGAPAGSIVDRVPPQDPTPDTAPAPAAIGTATNPAPYPPPVTARDPRLVDVRGGELPTRPPGRHRTPVDPAAGRPDEIHLDGRLNTVLDWLGRPDS